MRPNRSLIAMICLFAYTWPVAAQQPSGVPAQGPIRRFLAREAERMVASGECAASATAAAQVTAHAASQGEGTVRPLELHWNELGPLVTGQRVEIPLPDGRVVKGEAVAVRDDVLLVDARTEPKGSTSIPRASVTRLTLARTKGSGGRAVGTVIGVIAGLYLGGAAAWASDSEGGAVALFFGVTTAVSVGGYYLGKRADTHTMRITIVP